ncbi:hypothetical protein Pint_31307 [Pistacia integerrima]|uniref:Uncharacterized protein n=1 Tax=Pistacia integerrima TaxID=434235 RepID=A0ACC0XPJ5_9ROSI|nr:hypothetical protein Pint_31307 [Pistacia integerrima]
MQNGTGKADHAQLTKAYQTANVVFEVFKAINLTEALEIEREILQAQDKVAEKTQICVPYNILPLDPDSANQAIMIYPEVCDGPMLSHQYKRGKGRKGNY